MPFHNISPLDLLVFINPFIPLSPSPPPPTIKIYFRDFDCSFNKLQSFPSEMGKLKRLVRLKCNGNKLRSLPQEISKCKLLEEINCSENELLEVPPKMAVSSSITMISAISTYIQFLRSISNIHIYILYLT